MSDRVRAPSDPDRRRIELARGPASYTDEGTGPPVVAVHGLPGSARDFRWLAPALAGRVRLVRAELPGFGQTPVRAEPDPSSAGRARFVIELVRRLELERPVLLGHSMGGVVAAAALRQAPELFPGLALIASPGLRPHAPFRRLPLERAHAVLTTPILGRALAPILRVAFERGGFRGYPTAELYRTMACVAETSFEEHAQNVRALAVPTLVAWCEDDPLIEADIGAELAAACPAGPRLRFPTGGHNPQKTQAEALAEALVTWVEALRAPGAPSTRPRGAGGVP